MSKRAEISIQMIIIAILGLVALVILIFIFRGQVSGASHKYFDIVNESESELKGESCKTMWGGRKCMAACEDPYKYDLGTDYKDCQETSKSKSGTYRCCASEAGL